MKQGEREIGNISSQRQNSLLQNQGKEFVGLDFWGNPYREHFNGIHSSTSLSECRV